MNKKEKKVIERIDEVDKRISEVIAEGRKLKINLDSWKEIFDLNVQLAELQGERHGLITATYLLIDKLPTEILNKTGKKKHGK